MEKAWYIIISVILKTGSSDVVVIQEGSTDTLMYSGNINFRCHSFEWNRNDIAIQLCFLDSSMYGPLLYECIQPPFVRKAEANVQVINNVATTNLTIIDFYRTSSDSDEGVWTFRCTAPNVSLITSFDLKLYEKPHSLQCKHKFQTESLTVTCNSDGIYPQANFFFQRNKNPGIIAPCQNDLDFSYLYFNSTCMFNIPKANLSKGKLDVNVTIYPNLTASISDTNFGDSSLLTLNIESPGIILKNCNETNIIEGTPLSCTCERSDNSDIPTNTSWLINGTEHSTSSNRISVLISVSSRYNANYTCVAINVFRWQSSPLMYRPSVLYPSEVKSLLINGILQNPAILDNGSTLRIQCETEGNPEPSLYLMREKTQLMGPIKNNFTLIRNESVSCRDSGIYTCTAYNTQGSSQKNSTVLIKCPPQLQDPSTNEMVLNSFEQGSVSLNIQILGYPRPDIYTLFRSDVNVLTVYSSVMQSNKYEIGYKKESPPYGNVTLSIFNLSSEDFTNYTLVIYNGERGNLTYTFSLAKAVVFPGVNGDINTGAVVGGCVGALVLIVGAILFIIFIRRKTDFKCRNKKETNVPNMSTHRNQNDNIMELSNKIGDKETKNVGKKLSNKGVLEKLDRVLNVLESFELRLQVIEEKLKSQSETKRNIGDGAMETHYDTIKTPENEKKDRSGSYENIVGCENANYAYQEINVIT